MLIPGDLLLLRQVSNMFGKPQLLLFTVRAKTHFEHLVVMEVRETFFNVQQQR